MASSQTSELRAVWQEMCCSPLLHPLNSSHLQKKPTEHVVKIWRRGEKNNSKRNAWWMYAFPTVFFFFAWLLPWYTDNLRTKCCPLMWTGPEPDWRRKVTGGVISNPPKLIWGSGEKKEKKRQEENLKTVKIWKPREINWCEHKFHETLTDGMTDGFRMTRGTLVLFPS